MTVVICSCALVFAVLLWTIKHAHNTSSPHHRLAAQAVPWVFVCSGAILLLALKSTWSLSLPALLSLVVMLCAIAGMYKCAQHNTVKAKTLAIGLLLLVILGGTGLLYSTGFLRKQAPMRPELNLSRFECLRALILGKTLAEMHPGSKALLVTAWDTGNEQTVTAQIEALKQGFGNQIEVLGIERFEFGRDKKNNKYLKGFGAADFDKLVQQNPRCNLIVSMIGLPHDVEKMKLWEIEESERPKVAILDGNIAKLGAALKDGSVSAATVYRPGWTYQPNIPQDPRQAFDSRYLLITADNVDSVSKAYRFFR